MVTIPPDATQVTLGYWYWPDTERYNLTDNAQIAAIFKGDVGAGGAETLRTLMRENTSATGWQYRSFDLLRELPDDIRGQQVTVYFSVYNDGQSNRSWMYLDDVNLNVCRP